MALVEPDIVVFPEIPVDRVGEVDEPAVGEGRLILEEDVSIPGGGDAPSPRVQDRASSIFVAPTGKAQIDGLLFGRKWSQSSLTYSFPNSFEDDYGATYDNYASHAASFAPAPERLQTSVRRWLTDISAVTQLSFTELEGPENSTTADGNATIRVAMSNDPVPAYAYEPSPSTEAGDVWFNRAEYGLEFEQARPGDYAWHTIGHEIAHGLGLKHGHERGGVAGVALPSELDSMEFSIMTYRSYVDQDLNGFYANADGHYAQSLMMLDIAALQTLYGANFNTNADDTEYRFSPTTGEVLINGQSQGTPTTNTIFRTVWDGGGIDTYNASNYETDLRLNLTPGASVDLDVGGTAQRANLGYADDPDRYYARGHVFNALPFNDDPRSLIENAIGGRGDDDIIGNSAANRLEGRGGDDRINGRDGRDTLLDGFGQDELTGGRDADLFILAADGQPDRITDFEPERDRLDLSNWGLENRGQISVMASAGGTQLQFQNEILQLDNLAPTSFDMSAII